MFSTTARRTAAITVLAAGLGAGLAAPAFASGNPVDVTATVNQSITMSGPPASLHLAGDPGTEASGGVSYTITTNDAAGYTVTVTPSATWLANGAAHIDNSSMGYIRNGSGLTSFSGSSPLTAASKNVVSGASGDTYNDTFKLAIPGNATSGTYAETFTYLATGQ